MRMMVTHVPDAKTRRQHVRHGFVMLAAVAGFLLFAGSALHAQEIAGAPAAPPPPAGPTLPVIGSGHLPRDLSPWSMFVNADILVQAVILGLAFASLVTWTVWLAKTIELQLVRRRLIAALATISAERSLAAASASVADARGILPALINAALLELRRERRTINVRHGIARHFQYEFITDTDIGGRSALKAGDLPIQDHFGSPGDVDCLRFAARYEPIHRFR